MTRENWTIPPGERHRARNLLVEQLARVKLPGNAHSILPAIARTTIYCNRWWKFIDCRYLESKTGIDRRTIRRTLSDLRRKNVLLYEARNHLEDPAYRGRDKASAIGINFDFQSWSVPQRIPPENAEEFGKDVRGESGKDARLGSGTDAQPHYENSKRNRAAAASPSASLDAAGSHKETPGQSELEPQTCLLCQELTAQVERPPLCIPCSDQAQNLFDAVYEEIQNLEQEELTALLRETGIVTDNEIEHCSSMDDRAVFTATRWLALHLLQEEKTE